MNITKGNFIEKNIIKNLTKNKSLKTFSRNSVIISSLINKTIFVYNGQKFFKILITDAMVGHKLGEFSPTRKKFSFKKKKKHGSKS